MTEPNLRIDAGPLSLRGFERLFDQLPATTRAQIAWTPAQTRLAIEDFVNSTMDEAALGSLARAFLRQLKLLEPAFKMLMTHRELVRGELEAAWRADEETLRAYVDEPTADAADWVFRAWRAFTDLSVAIVDLALTRTNVSLFDDVDETLLDVPGFPVRVQVILMAAIELTRRGGSHEIVTELVNRAFDEMSLTLEQLRATGIKLDPFKGETTAERAQRFGRYADHIRDTLTEEDMRVLDEARVRELR